MIRLIITADDKLYNRLARRVRAEGDTPLRAEDALGGLERAMTESPGSIMVDMTLRSADTLLETLHSRRETTSIPLLAVTADGWLPFELHRLCAAVLEVKAL